MYWNNTILLKISHIFSAINRTITMDSNSSRERDNIRNVDYRRDGERRDDGRRDDGERRDERDSAIDA